MFKRPLHVACLLMPLVAASAPIGAEPSSQFSDVVSTEVALTLAQVGGDDRPETILVLKQSATHVEALNLSKHYRSYPADSLDLVAQIGYQALVRPSRDPAQTRQIIAKQALILAPALSSSHVAAGTNYKEHGEEAGIGSVFLFPKFSQPVMEPVQIKWHGDALLDYEVEMCVRFQQDIDSMAAFEASLKAFSLCGDFTDRATLLRKLDTDDVASGRGFTDAKSGKNLMPLGLYSVVANDWRGFLDQVEISLSVNGKLRQKTMVREMIKPLDHLMADLLASKGKRQWLFAGNSIPLTQTDGLQKGQILLTGTPQGVVYNQPSWGAKIWGGFLWAVSFSFLEHSAVEHVLLRQIAAGLESKAYLQPGDRVALNSNHLGSIQVMIK